MILVLVAPWVAACRIIAIMSVLLLYFISSLTRLLVSFLFKIRASLFYRNHRILGLRGSNRRDSALESPLESGQGRVCLALSSCRAPSVMDAESIVGVQTHSTTLGAASQPFG